MDRSREQWLEFGRQLRVDSIRAAAAAGSGHPTSSMSAADLMAVLFAAHLRYDFTRPDLAANDHLIFSKGHASPLLYALFKAAGAISDDELLSFRRLGSRLEGHPTPVLPWVDVATGSLGQGLPIAVGIALAGRRLDDSRYRIWCLCGDGEMAEGSMWEAFEHAGHAGLANLTAIIDVNRLGQTGATMYGWNLDAHARRAEACGWQALEIDGHDVDAIDRAYTQAAATTDRPTVIVARTVKGSGVSAVADRPDRHGKPLDDPARAIAGLGGERPIRITVAAPATGEDTPGPGDAGRPVVRTEPSGGDRDGHAPASATAERPDLPRYRPGDRVATRKAYGEALAAVAATDDAVVILDGEVSNSTYAGIPAARFPERYFEMYIAEQQMVAAAVGMQVRGRKPFASSFGAFLTRAFDFIRMAAVSRADIRLCGSHAGVSIGEDGPSQMALEDIAMMRAVHGSVVLHPCDANQTAQLVAAMAGHGGIVYLRTLRGATPVIYGPEEAFPIGASRIVRSSDTDDVTLVAAGITVHEACAAADILAREDIDARVIDCYSIKPIDGATLREAAETTAGMVTVEDHWPAGGLGEAVLAALAEGGARPPLEMLAVRTMPGSGRPAELLAAAGIDAAHIADAARRIVASSRKGAGR